jgi:hypothetical protein
MALPETLAIFLSVPHLGCRAAVHQKTLKQTMFKVVSEAFRMSAYKKSKGRG